MAASSPSAQQDHHRSAGDTGNPRDAKPRRHHLDHLEVQVPTVVPHNAASCFIGCFRPSPTSTTPSSPSPAAHAVHGHGHADRPASPSLIRSPTAWIRAFGSGNKHTHRRSRDFQYDATSYARNFDEGGTDGEGEEEAGLSTSDAHKYRMFSSRLPTSPPAMSPSGLGPGKGMEPAPRETGSDRE
ncbi:hypothetical protein EJB05_22328, partial [Eragrostis curvula]